MRASIKLGRILGVDVALHYSWFVIAGLIVLGLAGRFHAEAPLMRPAAVWLSAAATAAAFFAGLLIHELAHVAAARSRGLGVRGITLFALGGVAESAEDARDPGSELLIGVVGPLTSAGLGLLGLGAARAIAPLSAGGTVLQLALSWLGGINLALAAFNMLPAYPMDGGRVLRAAVWKATGSRAKATRMAAAAGQLFAGLLVLVGGAGFLGRGALGGLWLAFMGLFLFQAAATSAWSAEAFDALRRVRVEDIMSAEWPAAGPDDTLMDLVEDKMLRGGRRCVLVRRDGRLLGLVTPRDVGRVARDRWTTTPVGEAMVPVERVRTVKPDATIYDALEIMGRDRIGQLPVVADGGLVGLVTQADIVRTLSTRRELGRLGAD